MLKLNGLQGQGFGFIQIVVIGDDFVIQDPVVHRGNDIRIGIVGCKAYRLAVPYNFIA